MTLPDERTRSIKYAREFMRALLDPKKTPKVPRKIRDWAHSCLRHFPSDLDIDRSASKVTDTWGRIEWDTKEE